MRNQIDKLPCVTPMEQDRRRTTRYAFGAIAEIVDRSGAEMRTRVTDISVCGCHLLANGRLTVGAGVIIKIHTSTDYFQTSSQVVRSTASDVAVEFYNVNPVFLPVLQKWIAAARSASALTSPNTKTIRFT